jgi:hypothetical protein
MDESSSALRAFVVNLSDFRHPPNRLLRGAGRVFDKAQDCFRRGVAFVYNVPGDAAVVAIADRGKPSVCHKRKMTLQGRNRCVISAQFFLHLQCITSGSALPPGLPTWLEKPRWSRVTE